MCQRHTLLNAIDLGNRTLQVFGPHSTKTHRDNLIRHLAVARNTIEAIDEVLFGALPGNVRHDDSR